MSLSMLLSALLAGVPVPESGPTGPPSLPPATKPAELPLDGKDHLPILLGLCTAEDILRHREVFRNNVTQAHLQPAWKARWKALDSPCVLVVAFGSWCGDSQQQLPDLLALMQEPHPFVEVRLVGVGRDKKADPAAWPKGASIPVVERVPTFWLYSQQPGGACRLVGSIVETPPVPGQRMAQALLDLLEQAR